MKARRVWTSTAKRPYADQVALAWSFAIAIVAAMVMAGWVGYEIGANR